MKSIYIKIFIILFFFHTINSQCIQGNNCPNNQGFCKAEECICINNFWTLKNNDQTTPIVYCNYKKKNHFLLLISEFFIPSLGHFLAGKYYLAIIKLTLLLVIPILSFLIGFVFYYEEGNHHGGPRGNGNSLENNEDNEHHLHVANREERGVDLSVKMPVLISMVSWGFCAGMHIIDIIFYFFCIYEDGYGAPLA